MKRKKEQPGRAIEATELDRAATRIILAIVDRNICKGVLDAMKPEDREASSRDDALIQSRYLHNRKTMDADRAAFVAMQSWVAGMLEYIAKGGSLS